MQENVDPISLRQRDLATFLFCFLHTYQPVIFNYSNILIDSSTLLERSLRDDARGRVLSDWREIVADRETINFAQHCDNLYIF